MASHDDADRTDSADEPRPVDQVLVPDAPHNRSRTPWVVAAAILVAVALGLGVIVVSSSSNDTASSSLPKLGLRQSPNTAAMSSESGYTPTYELGAPLPDLGATGPVTRLVGHVTGEDVGRWAAALGLGAPEQQDWGWSATAASDSGDTTELRVETGTAGPVSVQYGPSYAGFSTDPAMPEPGVVEPYDPSVPTTGTTQAPDGPGSGAPAPTDVPSDAEAEAIARDLLGRMGVLGEGSWTFESGPGLQSVSGCVLSSASSAGSSTDATGTGEATDSTYAPSLPPSSDLDSCGSGTQTWSRTVVVTDPAADDVDARFWNVTVGSGGRIDSVSGTWGTSEALGEYPLQTTQAAFDQLVAGDAVVVGVGMAASGVGMPVGGGSVSTVMPETTTTIAGTEGDAGIATPAPEPGLAPDMPSGSSDVVTVTSVSLTTGTLLGQVDGVDALLVVPVYEFQTAQGPNAQGTVSVVALDPQALEAVSPTDDTILETPLYPDDPGPGGLPCATATIPEVCDGTMPPGSSGGGAVDNGPVTTIPVGAPDSSASSAPASSVPTTVPG